MALTKISSGLISDDAISTASLADGIIQAAHLHASHGITTANIAEGSNQYHTTARARAAVSVGGSLAYNSSTGVVSFTQRTDGTIRGLVSVTDSGGDGSLAYNNSTGVITYTGPSASEVRAHLSAGTGVTYSSGAISIGQSVATNATPTFGNITTTGYIAGPASFTIDPAAVGDNTGTVVIAGNLQVDGTTTTINSTTVAIDDLNFSIATDAADSAAANGAGITIGGASATMLYTHASTSFDFNKPIKSASYIEAAGNISTGANGGRLRAGGSNEMQLYFTGSHGILSSSTGNFTVDSAGDIILDAGGQNWYFDDDGTRVFSIAQVSSDVYIGTEVADKDMIFRVNDSDGGGAITALTLDASEAGAATFNAAVTVGGNLSIAPASNTPYIRGGQVSTIFRNNANDTSLITILDNGTTTFAGNLTAGALTLASAGVLTQTVGSSGGVYHSITHTGNEAWSWAAQSGSGSDDYLDVGISGGTRIMSWHEDGKVGIRDTAPQDYLEINGSGSGLGGLTISNSSHNHAALSFARSSTATARIYISEPDATHTSAMYFQTSDASGGSPNLVTAMVIDDHQNVGINVEKNGNSAPQKTFHVEHTAGASEGILISGASDTTGHTAGILLRAEGGEQDSALRAKGAIFFERTATYGLGKLHLANNTGNDNNSATISDAKLTISGGNVGIGETTPDTALHIKQTNNSTGDMWTGTGPGNVPSITIQNAGTSDNNHAAVYFKDNDGHRAAISARFENHSTNKTHLGFSTTDSSGNGRQRVKLTSNDQNGADFIGEEGPNAVSSTAGDNWSLVADRAMEVIQDNNNASSWITMKQFRLTNNAKSLSVKWAAKNQSGAYYWAWRILRNGSVTKLTSGSDAQNSFSYGLASGESSSVHAFRSYDVDIGEAYAGDEITLQMVNSSGGGTPQAGTQYLYCKQFEVTTLDYAKAQVDRHGTIRRPLIRGATQSTGYNGNEYTLGHIEIPFWSGSGTHNIIELAEYGQGTVGHAELHFAGLYAYAGRNFCQGMTMTSTRRRSSNSDWEDIDGGTVYFTQGANGDVTAPDFYWADGVLKVGISSSVQITGYIKVTWAEATIQRHWNA